ncbi:MAG: hypothetical protein V7L20_25815 [Nostoc sp.]|uniref:hypothetical protein n=1 Tax=Nostoc sp. TaxID=1180 RepID=UPI002FF8BADB
MAKPLVRVASPLGRREGFTLRYRIWRLPLAEDRAASPKFKIPLEKFCSPESDTCATCGRGLEVFNS